MEFHFIEKPVQSKEQWMEEVAAFSSSAAVWLWNMFFLGCPAVKYDVLEYYNYCSFFHVPKFWSSLGLP